MDLQQVLADPPAAHQDPSGNFFSMSMIHEVLTFIHANIHDHSTTLETGCGSSTVIFALAGAHHTVITPAEHELERIKEYCRERNISTDKVRFTLGLSQWVLPALELPLLDLVLIDGCHGFPAPYIDWFYTAGKIKVGGLLVVDDVWVWSCQLLKDVLQEQPEWEIIADFPPRTTVFRKKAEGSEYLEWTRQPYVARNGYLKFINGVIQQGSSTGGDDINSQTTALSRVLGHVRKGEFSTIAKKIVRRISN